MRKTNVVACCALMFALSACGSETPTTGQLTPALSGPAGFGLFHDVSTLVTASTFAMQGKPCRFSMNATSGGESAKDSGQGEFDGVKTEISLTASAEGTQYELLLIDNSLYIAIPPEDRRGGRIAWLSVPTDGTASDQAKSFKANIDQTVELDDPNKLLDQITKAGTIDKAERTSLDGKNVGHYLISLSWAKMQDYYPLSVAQRNAAASSNLRVKAELWLDPTDRPVRAMFDTSEIEKVTNRPGQEKFTVDYTDWGVPAAVQTPPADQIGQYH